MSIFRDLKALPESDPEVTLYHLDNSFSYRKPDAATTWWTHLVRIYVVPTRHLYTVRELQAFMDKVSNSFGLTTMTQFSSAPGFMNFGMSYIDEVVGSELQNSQTYLHITDPDIELTDDFTDGKLYFEPIEEKKNDLFRRIVVRFYPDMTYAHYAVTGKYVDSTPYVDENGVAQQNHPVLD